MILSVNKAGHIYHLAWTLYFVTVDTMKRQAVNITNRSQGKSVRIITHEAWLERFSSKFSNFAKCALLCVYAASDANFLPTFRENLSNPSSKVKNNPE